MTRHWLMRLLLTGFVVSLGLLSPAGPLASLVFALGGSTESPPPEPPPPEPSPEPPTRWAAYGYAFPGNPVYSAYGFGLPDPYTKDLLGLAAKGNIVMGNYTAAEFQTKVLPFLKPGADSRIQPYVIDPTDEALGYLDGYNGNGEPIFNGNYNREDGGKKWDGTQWITGSTRKFYESSVPDAQFQALLDEPLSKGTGPEGYSSWINAVLFTNHALAGLVKSNYLTMMGSLVARDEALIFNRSLSLSHDLRLLNRSGSSATLVAPLGIQRPQLTRWQECPPSGCAP